MSGGHFDYAYSRVNMFCEDLEMEIVEQGKTVDGCQHLVLSEPVEKKLKEILKYCSRASEYMREAEWLYSGDTGDESFMERIKEIEKNG